jgi:translation initiation factor IF-2
MLKQAGVPIIFAINRVDKPNANPEKRKLAGMNLLVEDWGGKIQSHDISAKQGTGVKNYLKKVLLEAELLDLKSNQIRTKEPLLEAFLDKGWAMFLLSSSTRYIKYRRLH